MEPQLQYQLGSTIICPINNTISNQGAALTVDNKSMQVLLLLIEHQGKCVTKEQIFEHVWKGKFVTDDILSVTVSKIRKALGDNARSPTFIKTLSGEGYLFIAKAQKIDSNKDINHNKRRTLRIKLGALLLFLMIGFAGFFIMQNEDVAPNQLKINSIAVLPFDDLSSSADNQYFTDGLSDAIIHQLSQINSLKVISRYSSFTYRGTYNATDIGQALQVDTLLDGSVQTVGDQIRINVRIFSTENGQQLWSKTYDGDSQDIFELQDRISSNIQAMIQPDYRAPSTMTKTINAQAYEWYLMGQFHWRQRNPQSLAKAVTYFKHSLESEPDYADAHVGLGITYAFLHTYGNWDEKQAIDAALPHINQALELEPNSALALAAKGLVLTEKAIYMTRAGQEDPAFFEQAQHAFLRSLELEDNATTHQWYSALLKWIGSESDVIHHLNKAIALNPLSAPLKRSFSFELLSMGKQDSAQRMFQRALNLEPDYVSRLIESSQINRYTEKSILEMSAWHKDNPALFSNCSSDEYCEHIVFTYLSIGADQLANEVLANMGPTHFHFRTSLNAINASANGDDQEALRTIERFALWLPENRRILFHYAIAQFRAGKFEQAEKSLVQLHPEWGGGKTTAQIDVTADNYNALVLYAATLLKLQEQETANTLFNNLETFINQGEIFDNTNAEFTLAEIHAQMGNKQQALMHLTSALKMGWMETFSKEWWSLANNHLLQPLYDEVEFQQLLNQHQEKRASLREAVIRNVNADST